MAENSNKITAWEGYNYEARGPDLWDLTGVFGGYCAVRIYYHARKRPVTSLVGMATVTSCMVTGIVLGRVSRIVREKYFKKRQVFVEDYVAAHPEQFVSEPQPKFKDVIWKWSPVR
ncbi:uncharacterized protein LOC132743653 [Ruditapes philippinarum]|uniref:uncharacterized protein LOC132743653 n=1 Tax=Ruditapes philippinarum TaxID=129788 RepID=UPI00295AAA4C|nr:uncharacterized protein LOC132743653 [Ruditapes philippinarum]